MTKKYQVGRTINNSINKTVVVLVETKKQHPIYKKIITKTKRYLVQDETNLSKTGNLVLIEKSLPISKFKHWKIKEILRIY